ncbi:MAG: peptidyl-prolyl cis-trans isomerase [Nitrospirae bacterium]|nr:peptidyl-prolyl cis-trans isomerase [Nitrospirota bacterium]
MEIGHRIINLSLVLSTTLIFLPGCSGSDDMAKSSQVLARVGKKEITINSFERQLGNLPESIQKLAVAGKGKRALLEGMVNREILYSDAVKKSTEKDAELQRKLEDIKKELIVTTYLQKEVLSKIKVEDKDVQNYYNSHPDEFKNREEVRLSQIVLSDKKEADDMLLKLKEKKEFAELAARYSTDKISALRRGDVGYFIKKQLPAEVREDIFKMKVGEISGVYKMSGGYEIYRITDRRTVSYTFEQVKDGLKNQLKNEQFQESLKKHIDELKKDIKVQVNENLLEKIN